MSRTRSALVTALTMALLLVGLVAVPAQAQPEPTATVSAASTSDGSAGTETDVDTEMLPNAAEAAGANKWRVIERIWVYYYEITDGFSPSGGTTCASDLNSFTSSSVVKGRVCAMKAAGVWSGSKFYPFSNTQRDEFAKYVRRAQADMNARYPARVINRTTSVTKHGNGCNQFNDVNCSPSAEAHGIGFMNYHSIDKGKPWGSNTYKPNDATSFCGFDCGVEVKLRHWWAYSD